MKNRGPQLPHFGDDFLQSGSSVIHFYYSRQEQLRFEEFLNEGLRQGCGVVLAATPDVLARFAGVRAPRFTRRRGELRRVELGTELGELNTSIEVLVQAIHEELLERSKVRVLADFASLVTQDDVFEVEADLSSALHGLPVIMVTQYDGNAVSAPITLEQFKTHSLAVVGNAFYYENRHSIPPEQYYRKRRAVARAAGR